MSEGGEGAHSEWGWGGGHTVSGDGEGDTSQ